MDTPNGNYKYREDVDEENKKANWIEAIMPFIQWISKGAMGAIVAATMVWLTMTFYNNVLLNQLEYNKDVIQYLKDK